MTGGSLLLASFLIAIQFQISGEIVAPPGTMFQQAKIESADGKKVVKVTDISRKGKFSFKVPEGLYKLTITTQNGLVEQRTVEARQAFADEYDEIKLKIELTGAASTAPPPKTPPATPNISPKAVEELQHANDAKGKTKKAEEHLQKALEISPNFPEALNGLGAIYMQQKQFTKAAELFQKALDINPDFYPAHVSLGGAFLALGDYDRAVSENSKAVQLQPNDSVAQSQMGQALFRLKRYDEALSHLELAKQLDPMSYTLPGLYIAQIHQARGENAAAIAEYKEFLKLHPGHEFVGSIQNEIIFLEKQTPK